MNNNRNCIEHLFALSIILTIMTIIIPIITIITIIITIIAIIIAIILTFFSSDIYYGRSKGQPSCAARGGSREESFCTPCAVIATKFAQPTPAAPLPRTARNCDCLRAIVRASAPCAPMRTIGKKGTREHDNNNNNNKNDFIYKLNDFT